MTSPSAERATPAPVAVAGPARSDLLRRPAGRELGVVTAKTIMSVVVVAA
jgi:hypothetical protein